MHAKSCRLPVQIASICHRFQFVIEKPGTVHQKQKLGDPYHLKALPEYRPIPRRAERKVPSLPGYSDKKHSVSERSDKVYL